jgi:hypothetical protein
MKRDVMEKWVTALRSGDYTQTTEYLYNQNGMCCLGVLCDLYAKDTNTSWVIQDEDDIVNDDGYLVEYCVHSMHDDYEVLPVNVQDWAGMRSLTGTFQDKHPDGTEYSEDLTILNDRGVSFNRIANIIEAKWETM